VDVRSPNVSFRSADPLLADLTVSIVHRMDTFSPMQLVRITKSLVALGLWRADFGVELKRHTRTKVWAFTALAQLCDAAYPCSSSLSLEDNFYTRVGEMLSQCRESEVEKHGGEHFGSLGTGYAMRHLGIGEPDYDFISSLGDDIGEHALFCSSKIQCDGAEDGCTRRGEGLNVLCEIVDDFRRKHTHVQGRDDQLSGVIKIGSTLFPSLNCISGLMRFRGNFPLIVIQYVQLPSLQDPV